MNKKLKKVLIDFSMGLHSLEEEGIDLPIEVSDVWSMITFIIEEDKEELWNSNQKISTK